MEARKLTAEAFLEEYEDNKFDTNLVMDELFDYVKKNDIITIYEDGKVTSENGRVQGQIEINYVEVYEIESHGQTKYIGVEDMKDATIEDLYRSGWSYDDIGIQEDGENENGETLFSMEDDYNKNKYTWDEIKDELCDGYYCVSYWDGNNWQYDIWESCDFGSPKKVIISKLPNPNPPYYFNYEFEFENGEKIDVSKSNMSGELSPYYDL